LVARVLRDFVVLRRGLAAPVAAAPDERVDRLAVDLARVAPAFAAVDRALLAFLAFGLAVERFVAEVERALVDRALLARCAPGLSSVHLPDITRCAASATASAMIEPSLVALDTMLLAACEAVSAASSPASRILRRAAGLALIAAAAAARPAASISLLIAAFANLSTVLSFAPEDLPADDFEDVFLVDLAILLSLRRRKDTSGPFRFPNDLPCA
jgi:hypothetical protein